MNPRVTGIDYRLTMRRYRPTRSRGSGPAPLALYLELSCRPSREWVKAFRGERDELGVSVPPRFSLYEPGRGARAGHRGASGQAKLRRWTRRAVRLLLPHRRMRLVVSQCGLDEESARAALAEARALLAELDTALRESEIRSYNTVRRHEAELQQLLEKLRASEPTGSGATRGREESDILFGGPTAD